jgi:phage host-nuclease inhibitor protein Gam
MGKRVKTTVEELSTWDEVDQALRKIGECEIGIETFEADMNREINDAKAKAEKLVKPLQTAMTVLEAQVRSFVTERKKELDGKSRALTFGTVGFRQATSITYSTKKTEEILERLKKLGMTNCIAVKESISKAALALYPDKELNKAGVTRKVEDQFFCDADREKIRG